MRPGRHLEDTWKTPGAQLEHSWKPADPLRCICRCSDPPGSRFASFPSCRADHGVPHQQLRQASEPRLRRLSGIIHLILLGPRPAFAPHSDVLNVTIKAIKKAAGIKGANIWPRSGGDAAPHQLCSSPLHVFSILHISLTRFLSPPHRRLHLAD